LNLTNKIGLCTIFLLKNTLTAIRQTVYYKIFILNFLERSFTRQMFWRRSLFRH